MTATQDDDIIFTALALSKSRPETLRACSEVIYFVGATKDQPRKMMLEKLTIWEQLVSDDFDDVKRRFRRFVEGKASSETDRA